MGQFSRKVNEVLISRNMRIQEGNNSTKGLYEPTTRRIIILKNELRSIESFAETFLHEVGHAMSGNHDVSRDFENVLSNYIGLLAARLYKI